MSDFFISRKMHSLSGIDLSEWIEVMGVAEHSIYIRRDTGFGYEFAEGECFSVIILGVGATHPRILNIVNKYTNAKDVREMFSEVKSVDVPFAIIVASKAAGVVYATSDVFGSMPIYLCKDGPIIATSQPDIAGCAANSEYDIVSYYDMIINSRICFPYTLYSNVVQSSPKAFVEVRKGDYTEMITNWTPPAISPNQAV